MSLTRAVEHNIRGEQNLKGRLDARFQTIRER
jgi:hypothetical protein